jgi:hypothetical protein
MVDEVYGARSWGDVEGGGLFVLVLTKMSRLFRRE